jgi:hypothetical protein
MVQPQQEPEYLACGRVALNTTQQDALICFPKVNLEIGRYERFLILWTKLEIYDNPSL